MRRPFLPLDQPARRERALLALDGLSVGDAFGERFFYLSSGQVSQALERCQPPPPPWRHTDDTEMALAVLGELERSGAIDQEELAQAFARRYRADPYRGYSGSLHRVLDAVARGLGWRAVAAAVHGGMGSLSNGAATRVAPLGAYFAEELDRVVEQARSQAEVTHAHPEGRAGAMAVAVAAAMAWRLRHEPPVSAGRRLLDEVLVRTPDGPTRDGIEAARLLPPGATVLDALEALGDGSHGLASDTVPYALWCIARHMGRYPKALWTAMQAAGDRDAMGAIVGGVVALSGPPRRIPSAWLAARGPLPLPARPPPRWRRPERPSHPV